MVVIVGFLVGGLLLPLSAQMEVRQVGDTQKTLDAARDALLGFAAANGRLPCPAAPAATGVEAPPGGGACSNAYDGYLPAITLGVSPTDAQGYAVDAWGHRIRYAVANITIGVANPFTTVNGMRTATMPALAAAPSTSFINVCNSAAGITATTCGTATALSGKVPALMFSLGRNGKTAGNDADESANLNADQVFVNHDPAPGGAPGGEFDDIVNYLSINQLFSRMIAGSALP